MKENNKCLEKHILQKLNDNTQEMFSYITELSTTIEDALFDDNYNDSYFIKDKLNEIADIIEYMQEIVNECDEDYDENDDNDEDYLSHNNGYFYNITI